MQVARKSKPVDLMAFAHALQRRYETATTVESRKEKGQVFHAGRRLHIHVGIIHADSRSAYGFSIREPVLVPWRQRSASGC